MITEDIDPRAKVESVPKRALSKRGRSRKEIMMKKFALVFCMVLVGAFCIIFYVTKDKKLHTPKETELCNKKCRIVSPDGEIRLGTYIIKAVSKNEEQKIEIIESLSMDYGGKKVEYTSTVVYRSGTLVTPESGMAETKMNGKTCMQGSVTFSENTYEYEGKGFLNKKTGEAIDPPRKFEEKDQPLPEGMLIFQSALPAISPRILPKEGELKNIVFVEFPDDLGAPELICFKEGHRLVREKPNANGEYYMNIYGPDSEDCISNIRFNKEDQIVSMKPFGKIKIEVEENKK